MKASKSYLVILLLAGMCFQALGQRMGYTVQNAHSHNDYENDVPFFTAYNAGFGSIEADVFPVNGKLSVAHNKASISSDKMLQSLYLDPLLAHLSVDKSRHKILLVDIKENYQISLPILITELSPLQPLINNGQLQIVIGGNRPAPAEFRNYPESIYFDDDQSKISSPGHWERVGMVSLRNG